MFPGGGFLQLLVGVASLAFAGLRFHCILLLAARAAAKVSARSARAASLCEMPHVSGRPRFDQVLPGPQVLLRFVRCFVCLIGFGATLRLGLGFGLGFGLEIGLGFKLGP